MEGFKVHPDLELLASIYRELSDNLKEAVAAHATIEGVLINEDVDALSLIRFAEANVTRVGAMMAQFHPEGAPCSHTIEIFQGMYMEAFVLGSRYAYEKHEWAKARQGAAGDPEKPA